jgi:hypothetical protein
MFYNPFFELANPGLAYDRFSRPCEIGHDVWIGANATILRGVRIGNGAVVGANAVVTRDVEPYAIVAGVPAVLRGFRFQESARKALEEIRWWDFPMDLLKECMPLLAREPDTDAIEALKRRRLELESQGSVE